MSWLFNNSWSALSLVLRCLIISSRLTSLRIASAYTLKEDTFNTIKSSDNVELCAASTPSNTTSAFSKFDCARQCQKVTSERCDGFKYCQTTFQCSLYYYRPQQYDSNVTGCLYYSKASSKLYSNDPIMPHLAYKRDAVQISTWPGSDAFKAVDGDYTTKSCTVSLWQIYGWWAVNLGKPAVVTSVNVTNDQDSQWAYRLDNFIVGVTNNDPAGKFEMGLTAGSDFTLCAQYSGGVGGGATVQVVCTPSSTQYQYVIIQSTYTNQALCLVEVQVF